jgi:hypothetical protein
MIIAHGKAFILEGTEGDEGDAFVSTEADKAVADDDLGGLIATATIVSPMIFARMYSCTVEEVDRMKQGYQSGEWGRAFMAQPLPRTLTTTLLITLPAARVLLCRLREGLV